MWSRQASEDVKFEDEDDYNFLSEAPPTRDESMPFLFKKLPAELKNAIYRLLIIPDYGEPLSVTTRPSSRRSQISTNILYVDREIYQEACAILYLYNILYIKHDYSAGQILRMDEQVGGTRRLRNGRLSGSTKFTGIIYPHVLRRFNKVHIDLQVHVYGLAVPGPITSEIFGSAKLKELLEVVSHKEPAGRWAACKSLRLQATENYYPSPFLSGYYNPKFQVLSPQLEQYGFPNIFEKIRETPDLFLIGNLRVSGSATLLNRILGTGD